MRCTSGGTPNTRYICQFFLSFLDSLFRRPIPAYITNMLLVQRQIALAH